MGNEPPAFTRDCLDVARQTFYVNSNLNFLGYINKVYIKRDSEPWLGRERVNELGNYPLERGEGSVLPPILPLGKILLISVTRCIPERGILFFLSLLSSRSKRSTWKRNANFIYR